MRLSRKGKTIYKYKDRDNRLSFRFLIIPRPYKNKIVWLETALVAERTFEYFPAHSDYPATAWKIAEVVAVKGEDDFESHAVEMNLYRNQEI